MALAAYATYAVSISSSGLCLSSVVTSVVSSVVCYSLISLGLVAPRTSLASCISSSLDRLLRSVLRACSRSSFWSLVSSDR